VINLVRGSQIPMLEIIPRKALQGAYPA
jgi:hypothetical protein